MNSRSTGLFLAAVVLLVTVTACDRTPNRVFDHFEGGLIAPSGTMVKVVSLKIAKKDRHQSAVAHISYSPVAGISNSDIIQDLQFVQRKILEYFTANIKKPEDLPKRLLVATIASDESQQFTLDWAEGILYIPNESGRVYRPFVRKGFLIEFFKHESRELDIETGTIE